MGIIISYFILLFYTLYMFILYESAAGIILVSMEIGIPFLFFVLLWFQYRKVTVRLNVPVTVAEKSSNIQGQILIKNDSIFPVNKITLYLVIEHKLTNKKEKVRIKSFVEGKGEQKLFCCFQSQSGGLLDISFQKVRLYDSLGLFFRRLKVTEWKEILIYPNIYDVNASVSEYVRRFPVESDVYDKYHKGDDSSEVYQVREYEKGDKIQSIHWKLSARTGECMIKDYSLPIGCAVILLFDWIRKETFLETAASICFALIKAKCSHYVAWFDTVTGDITRKEIQTEEDGYDFIRLILQTDECKEEYPLLNLYQERFQGETFAVSILLGKDFCLSVNNKLVFQFEENNIKQQLSAFELEF